jgi:hypothetical protein
MKMCPKIILKGTRLTHKTDIAFALNEHLMKCFVDASAPKTLRVDISDNNVALAVEIIADWMEQTGGLYINNA